MGVKDTKRLPVIAPADFDAFRRLMGHELPPSYAEWTERHRERMREYREREVIVEVPVKPAEFEAYCLANSRERNGMALLGFAASKV